VTATAVGAMTAVLAGLAPALSGHREGPVDVLRRVPPSVRSARLGLQMGVSLLLAVLGLGCVAAKGFLPARTGTYGGLVLMLVAVLVATPGLTALTARLLRRLLPGCLGVPGRLAVDNLSGSSRTGLVVGALAPRSRCSSTGGLLSSNEEGVRSWVDQSIAGDLFVTSGGPLSASGRTLPMGWSRGAALAGAIPDAQVVPCGSAISNWRQESHSARLLLVALDAALTSPPMSTATPDRPTWTCIRS